MPSVRTEVSFPESGAVGFAPADQTIEQGIHQIQSILFLSVLPATKCGQ